ncbi:MAG: hypothetical protein ACI8RZ_005959 [Myxococcota bacterium]
MLVALLALLTGCGGTVEMGGTCEASEDCLSGGACLKGACAAYACTGDADCTSGQECGIVGGVSVCATPCEAAGEDEGCPGRMSCQEFEAVGPEDEALYCL